MTVHHVSPDSRVAVIGGGPSGLSPKALTRAQFRQEDEGTARFLIKVSYSTEGTRGVQSAGGVSRRDAVAHMAAGLGGKLQSFDFAFGETDTYVVWVSPTSELLRRRRSRSTPPGQRAPEVVVLLAPEEIDAAAKLSVDYRPPGS